MRENAILYEMEDVDPKQSLKAESNSRHRPNAPLTVDIHVAPNEVGGHVTAHNVSRPC